MQIVDFERYRLRLSLECPLVGAQERRQHRAFDVYQAELVRDDAAVCAATEVYFVRIDDPGVNHARAAATMGSEFLVKVCLEALDWRGAVREHIEELFMDAMTDVFVLERINLLDPDADKPILRGLFVQAIFSTLSRGMDILFVRAAPDELPFWRDTRSAPARLASSSPRPVHAACPSTPSRPGRFRSSHTLHAFASSENHAHRTDPSVCTHTDILSRGLIGLRPDQHSVDPASLLNSRPCLTPPHPTRPAA
jgi:hypothetical protein